MHEVLLVDLTDLEALMSYSWLLALAPWNRSWVSSRGRISEYFIKGTVSNIRCVLLRNSESFVFRVSEVHIIHTVVVTKSSKGHLVAVLRESFTTAFIMATKPWVSTVPLLLNEILLAIRYFQLLPVLILRGKHAFNCHDFPLKLSIELSLPQFFFGVEKPNDY